MGLVYYYMVVQNSDVWYNMYTEGVTSDLYAILYVKAFLTFWHQSFTFKF